jgi:hypothetical protein
MQIRRKTFAFLLTLLGVGCAPISFAPVDPFASVKTGDLDPLAVEAFLQETNQFYKIDGALKDDIYVYVLRSSMLDLYRTQVPARVLLALGSLRDQPDCDVLQRKVPRKKMKSSVEKLDGYFHCTGRSYTEDEYVAQDDFLRLDSLNHARPVDAHMAWYAATGSQRPVEKLVRNLALNENACSCIFWALSSVAKEDPDFRNVVLQESKRYEDNPLLDKLRASIYMFDP